MNWCNKFNELYDIRYRNKILLTLTIYKYNNLNCDTEKVKKLYIAIFWKLFEIKIEIW